MIARTVPLVEQIPHHWFGVFMPFSDGTAGCLPPRKQQGLLKTGAVPSHQQWTLFKPVYGTDF
jgi:hypothetical protein